MKIYNRTAVVGQFFYFEMAVDGATKFLTENLPQGLTCNEIGQISGTPIIPSQTAITLLVSDEITCSAATLLLKVVGPSVPNIVSPNFSNGIVDYPLTYQIVASATPAVTSYGASNLPPGLSINTATGLISGTPTTATASTVAIVSATNSGGTVFQDVNFVILAMPLPVYSGPSSVEFVKGISNSFTVQNSNLPQHAPTLYSATNLPQGVSINTSTGIISGTPLVSSALGDYKAHVSAFNIKSLLGGAYIGSSARKIYSTQPLNQQDTTTDFPGQCWGKYTIVYGSNTTTYAINRSYISHGPSVTRRFKDSGGNWRRLFAGITSGPLPLQLNTNFYTGETSFDIYTDDDQHISSLQTRERFYGENTIKYNPTIFKLKDGSFLFTYFSGIYAIPTLLKFDSTFSAVPGFSPPTSAPFIIGQRSDGTVVTLWNNKIGFLNKDTGQHTSSNGVDVDFSTSEFRIRGYPSDHIIGAGLQPDGSIIFGTRNRLSKFSADGLTRDIAFFTIGTQYPLTRDGSPSGPTFVHVYKNGKILLVGNFNTCLGQPVANKMVRLLPDGNLDSTFSAGLEPRINSTTGSVGVKVLTDGKILLLKTNGELALLEEDGSVNSNVYFYTNGSVSAQVESSVTGTPSPGGAPDIQNVTADIYLCGPQPEDIPTVGTTASITMTNAGGTTTVPIDIKVVAY